MAAVSQTIPNLLGGVSQQPDPVKLPGQVRELKNAYLDPTFGCKKRPPTTFISKLNAASASDTIPSNAKWFPIFRDEQERYVACIYRTTTTVVRVWDAVTGTERTVTLDAGADAYLQANNLANLSTLQLADYTFIANSERTVTTNSVQLTNQNEEALVTINAVSYNTTYSIDLNSGGASPVNVYSATKLEVSPGSYEVNDGGGCSQSSAQDHSVTSGSKTGLQFRIVNQCSAYYDSGSNSYRSRYTTSVILKNGGSGWRVGDTATVTQAGRSFTVTVTAEKSVLTYASDGTATYTTASNASSGTLQVSDITTNLQSAVNALTNYSADVVGNVIRVTRTDGNPFNISVRGGTTNAAMTVIKETAQNIAELPAQCFPDFRCKVVNTGDTDADDYYVVFVPDAPGVPGTGAWEETHELGIETSFNSSTMPHALVRQANGNFTLGPLGPNSALGGWADREVGDDTTNPMPTFVGRGISGMFFFANRLGFLAEDSVVMSQPGDYFNFFITSAITISDADPIDLTAASEKPAFLKSAIGTPKGVLLFAENSQFLMATQDVAFAPSTVKVTEISNYNVVTETQPQSTGVSVMFASEADTYSKIFEMAIDSVDNRPVVAENTRIIPEYIPPDLKFIASSPNNSFIVFGDNSNTVYTFKFFNQGNERQLAGWSKWEFPSQVRMYAFNNDTSYIVTYDGTNHILLHMEMLDDPATSPLSAGFGNSKFIPRLDHILYKANLTTAVSGSNTKIYFPSGAFITGAQPVFIVTSGSSANTFLRPSIQSDATGSFIEVETSLTTGDYIMGLQYRMEVALPAFYVTTENKADRVEIPMVEILYLDLYYSGRYEIQLDRLGYATTSIDIDIARAGLYQANSALVDEVVTKSVPIFCLGSDAKATVFADDPVPSSITSYTWQGHYNRRGINKLPS